MQRYSRLGETSGLPSGILLQAFKAITDRQAQKQKIAAPHGRPCRPAGCPPPRHPTPSRIGSPDPSGAPRAALPAVRTRPTRANALCASRILLPPAAPTPSPCPCTVFWERGGKSVARYTRRRSEGVSSLVQAAHDLARHRRRLCRLRARGQSDAHRRGKQEGRHRRRSRRIRAPPNTSPARSCSPRRPARTAPR